LSTAGTLNTQATTISLSTGGTGATAAFNLIANPYASALDVGSLIKALGSGSYAQAIYLRNPQTSSYSTVSITGTYAIPAYCAFFLKSNGATSITYSQGYITSSNSTSGSGISVFGINSDRNKYLQARVYDDSNNQWDNFYLYLTANGKILMKLKMLLRLIMIFSIFILYPVIISS